jgi:hypothetical protein
VGESLPELFEKGVAIAFLSCAVWVLWRRLVYLEDKDDNCDDDD